MRNNGNNDKPVGRRLEEPSHPPAAPATTGEPPPVATQLGDAVVPGTVALVAGGVVLAIAIAWGAAEAAVGVGAAYLVYNAIAGRGDLSGGLATRLLTGVFRRPPAASPAAPPDR